ncbi:hypothetical protein HD597_009605 [Nonomuraea thailandensis]|uniref:Cholesterol esterase n=1 Tax=Nonomuraea thailandensis TaxID=1188745 RepID=A0A9X2GRG1_9ACTN|nr:DUF6230 family protein [Nonomuraea thailandensis]MCP2362585.1 hypothetical protein [Nonomuraea thailandensis]
MAEQGRVRWKRFGLIFAPVAALTSLLVGATAQGVIGAMFVVSGNAFKLAVGELRGQGFTLAGGVVETRKGRTIPVISTGIRRAVVTDLCQSALVRTPVGTITIRLTGGRAGNVVTIDNLVIDLETGRTGASIRDLELGRDAATLDQVPGFGGPAGTFGSQASAVTLRNVRLSPRAATAATFSLPDLGLDVVRGESECF